MNTYTILKKPDLLNWNNIPVAFINHPYHSEDVDISAGGQICYDESALYVHLFAKESNIRAEGKELLDAPCEDSCLEFFFSPINGDSRYINIEYNPNCWGFVGMGSCVDDLVRFIPETGFPFSPKANRTEEGWEITYQIPFSFVRRFFPDFSPTSGYEMRGNLYKCGDLTTPPHYFTWNKLTGNVLSFHRPCDFGLFIFE